MGLAGAMAFSPPFFSNFESSPRQAMLRGRVLPGGMTARASSPATISYLDRIIANVRLPQHVLYSTGSGLPSQRPVFCEEGMQLDEFSMRKELEEE